MREFDKKENAAEELKSQLRMDRDLRNWGAHREVEDNVTARNVLHQDLGRYAGRHTKYDLDEETRDRLIAHTRQDAAQALLNTVTLMKEMRKLKRWFAAACVAFLAMVFWVWWHR